MGTIVGFLAVILCWYSLENMIDEVLNQLSFLNNPRNFNKNGDNYRFCRSYSSLEFVGKYDWRSSKSIVILELSEYFHLIFNTTIAENMSKLLDNYFQDVVINLIDN